MKKLLALLLALMMVFSLAACGKDDDSAGKNNDGEEEEEQISGTFVLVSKEEYYADGEFYSGLYFSYDDKGRLVEIEDTRPAREYTYSYTYNEDNYITQSVYVDSSDCDKTRTYSYTFEDGTLSAISVQWDGQDFCTLTYSFNEDGSLETEYLDYIRGEDACHTYQYDNNGNITQITREWNHEDTFVTTLTYSGSSLVGMDVDSEVIREYELDEDGNTLSLDDKQLVYDQYGNIVKVVYSSGFYEEYTYERMDVPENLIPLMECVIFEYTECNEHFRFNGFVNPPFYLLWAILN